MLYGVLYSPKKKVLYLRTDKFEWEFEDQHKHVIITHKQRMNNGFNEANQLIIFSLSI